MKDHSAKRDGNYCGLVKTFKTLMDIPMFNVTMYNFKVRHDFLILNCIKIIHTYYYHVYLIKLFFN